MISKYIIVLFFVVLAFPIHHVYSESDTEHASKLWESIQKDKYQETWELFPGYEKLYKGTQPHGALLTTYVNGVAKKGLNPKNKELPYGSIIIKENYMPDDKLAAITVMERIEGYNPNGGDWFWVKYDPSGQVMTKDVEMDGMKKSIKLAGKPMGCVGCHTASISGIQYLMTPLKNK